MAKDQLSFLKGVFDLLEATNVYKSQILFSRSHSFPEAFLANNKNNGLQYILFKPVAGTACLQWKVCLPLGVFSETKVGQEKLVGEKQRNRTSNSMQTSFIFSYLSVLGQELSHGRTVQAGEGYQEQWH